jgi:RHS repeat-associated protein
MRITSRTVSRSPTNYRSSQYSYDNWGNTAYNVESRRTGDETAQVRTWTYYLGTSSQPASGVYWKDNPYTAPSLTRNIKNLPLAQIVENSLPDEAGGGSTDYRSMYFQYNTIGQKTAQSNWVDGGWAETLFVYEPEHGEIIQTVNPDGHVTDFAYDYNNPSTYYITATELAVKQADGTTRDLSSVTAYQRYSGFRAWEKNARGFVTEYDNDNLGRQIQIIKPDDNDVAGWDPREGIASFRSGNLQTNVVYDDIGFTATSTGNQGQVVTYIYDSLGKLIRIDKENRPRNVQGEIIAGPVEHIITSVAYDAWGNTVSIVDPRGFETNYQYDLMGRTSAVIYPPEEGLRPQKTMVFDYSTNIQTTTDERGNVSYETFDFNEELLKKIQYSSGQTIETRAWYDGLGSSVAATDGEGRKTITAYNELNLPTTITMPSEEYYESGDFITYSPRIVNEYDRAGNKVKETVKASDRDYVVEYEDDGLGRVIKTKKHYTDYTGDSPVPAIAVEEAYYDENGNKIMLVDANNTPKAQAERKTKRFVYNARDKVLEELDEAGSITRYTYDADDNQISMTDPRGTSGVYSGDFIVEYAYDDLNRLVIGRLPRATGQSEKPIVRLDYDARGNLVRRIDADGGLTLNDYNSRNKIIREEKKGTTSSGATVSIVNVHGYDKAGNETLIRDAKGNETQKGYDELNRLIWVQYPEGNRERLGYDKAGNRNREENGNAHDTYYVFDSQKRVTSSTDAKGYTTITRYNSKGNRTYHKDANENVTTWIYDERGLMIKETTSLGYVTRNVFDAAGYLIQSTDPNGTLKEIQYTDTYRPEQLILTRGQESQATSYSYDEAGDTKRIQDGGIAALYNTVNGSYVPDPYSLVHDLSTEVDGRSFSLGYAYDVMNRVTGVRSVGGRNFFYTYDTLGRLQTVPGYIDEPIKYDENGKLSGYLATNGMEVTADHDMNQRLTELHYEGSTEALTGFSLRYDDADNITRKNYSNYAYDELERLIYANQYGRYSIDSETLRPDIGALAEDYDSEGILDFSIQEVTLKLDYDAMSIGADLGDTFQVTKLAVRPQNAGHRVHMGSLGVYTAYSNWEDAYQKQTDWTYKLSEDGTINILFRQPVEARYVKLHCFYDDRNSNNQPVDKATVRNEKDEILSVSYSSSWRTESYQYDANGNRIRLDLEVGTEESKLYSYYANSDRLKSDGRYGFAYDPNGNLIEKGDHFSELNDVLTFSATEGDYWKYRYDLENRLVEVSHGISGTDSTAAVSSYVYDPRGLKIKSVSATKGVSYTIYGTDGKLVYEEKLKTQTVADYLYVFGRHFAKETTDNSVTSSTYYMTDNLGSTVMATDVEGKVVWSTDYTAFGESGAEAGSMEELGKYTGKDYDEDAQLYYSNTRWYDPQLGRFTSEDPARDGVNWYSYCANNPLKFVDPSGLTYKKIDDIWSVRIDPNLGSEGSHIHVMKNGKEVWNEFENGKPIHDNRCKEVPPAKIREKIKEKTDWDITPPDKIKPSNNKTDAYKDANKPNVETIEPDEVKPKEEVPAEPIEFPPTTIPLEIPELEPEMIIPPVIIIIIAILLLPVGI